MKRNVIIMLIAIMMMAMFTTAWADVTIGTGTTTSTSIPLATYYGYSYSQQIYTQAQIGTAGSIQKIRFYKNTTGVPANSQAWVIYMGHTTKTAFSTTTDWVPLASMTEVFNGTVTYPSAVGWMEITLATPFSYNNTDNLVIAIDENTPGYSSSSTSWRTTTSGTNAAIYYYSDSTNPSPSAPPTSTSRLATVNQLQIVFPSATAPNPATTPNPATLATDISANPTLSWVDGGGGATSYDVYFGTNPSPASIGNQATTTYSPVGLSYSTPYYWQIVPRNANGPATGCPVWSFTTMADPTITEFPHVQSFEGATYPPAGWTHTVVTGATGLQRVTAATTNPAVATAFDGSAMLFYNAFSLSTGYNAWLATPPLSCTDTNSNYRVRLAMWRDSSNYATNADRVEVYSNTTPNLNGSPVLLGTVNRSKTLLPVETGADGWYQYAFDIGIGSEITQFVIIKAVSGYGNNMNLDNVEIFAESAEAPPSAPISFSPANAATNVAINANLSWANGGGVPNNYKVFMGTDPESLEMVASQPETTYDPIDNLLFGKTYYWYVSAMNDAGSSDSAVISFTTAPGTPVITTPSNNSTTTAINALLNWADVAGATGYKISVGTESGLTDIANGIACATSEWTNPVNWNFNRSYFWTVTVLNGDQDIVGTEWKFTTVAGAPVITSPLNNAVAQDPSVRILNWADVTGATGYKVKAGTTTGASDLVNNETVAISQYTHTSNWPYSAQIFWTVTVLNGAQEVVGTEWNFTTGANPTLTPPFLQDFASFPPTNWTRFSGNLAAPSVLTTTTSGWGADGYANNGTTGAARVNIYGTSCKYWLVTPPIDLGSGKISGFNLEFDLALTAYGLTTAAATTGVDDIFAVIISTDGGSTWTSANTLMKWDNAGSANVYNNIATAGQHVTIDLSAYTGMVKIAFYGESLTSNADNDLFIDNVAVASAGAPPSAPVSPSPANAATNVAINANLAWGASSGSPTGYKVYLSTNGVDFDMVSSQESNVYDPAENFGFATTYSWNVMAVNDNGDATSATWTFTTTNGKAITPAPANNAVDYAATSLILDWADVAGATGYKIKVGTTVGGSEVANMVDCATSAYTKTGNWAYGTKYYWTVYTVNGAQQVQGDEWNFTVGADPTITSIPYLNDFQSNINGWTILNVNNDSKLWNRAIDGSPNYAMSITYNSALAMDDWFITPPINLVGGTTYQIKYNYKVSSSSYPENLKVAVGTAPTALAMTTVIADHPGIINLTYALGTATFTPETSGSYFVGFHGYSAMDMFTLYVDNFRILTYTNTDIATGTAAAGSVTVTLPAITNTVTSAPLSSSVAISGLANPTAPVTVTVGYASGNVSQPNAGLNFTFGGTSFAGATITFTHNLGFVPVQLAFRIIGGAGWIVRNNPGSWTTTTAVFSVPAGKADGDVEVVFPQEDGQTLPVELSSFTAIFNAEMYVQIAWLAESETNHSGYNVLRSEIRDLETALRVNSELIADGTELGTQISYSFKDNEVDNNTNYYYWLESVALDGSTQYAGPLMVSVNASGDNPGVPQIPVSTVLMSAYPNPFNPQTNLRYSLKEAGNVTIDVFNVKGQIIRSFTKNHATPGYFSVTWDGKDNSGSSVSSGVYFYRMVSGKYSATRKMMLMK
ncbi:MAG: hypothetical protein CVU48_00400 [Candidatus Cloacimonetes bacterium HGW-Cloacimonetes-1]|nr:MAG: hypothetical protein CVU48_00400 [Candidatus Cloacimonetes bacterium HGW-Cloacimonetes-1]